MCGSATLAMLVSSTSMKVANVTVKATIHGVAVFDWRADALLMSFSLI